MRTIPDLAGQLRTAAFLAGTVTFAAVACPASAQEFFVEQEFIGEVTVVDASGAEVPIVNGTPFGTRPGYCPSDSYYFNDLESDKAEVVLTDCATGEGAYEVQALN